MDHAKLLLALGPAILSRTLHCCQILGLGRAAAGLPLLHHIDHGEDL